MPHTFGSVGFFTFLVALAHSAIGGKTGKTAVLP